MIRLIYFLSKNYSFRVIKRITPFNTVFPKNLIIKIILKFFRFIIYIFVFLFFKIFKLKTLNSPLEALGHQCWDLECIFIDENFTCKDKRILIPYHENYFANKYLFDNFQILRMKKKLKFKLVHSRFFCLILFLLRPYKSLSLDTKFYISNKYVTGFKLIKDQFKYYIPKDELYNKGIEILKRNKIKLDKKFVLIHARDSSYKPFDNETYRNTDINTFSLLVNYLLEKNFIVVRSGNFGMKKSFFDNNIIDLTNKKLLKGDKKILDVFLSAYCEFMVGTCSGFNSLSALFGKKILSVNMVPYSHSLCIDPGLSLPKLYRYKNSKKFLSFKEIVSLNYDVLKTDELFKKNNIELIDNTENEILDAFKDLENFDFKNKIEDNLQKKYRNNFLLNGQARYCYESVTSVAPSFIKKYSNLL